MNEALGQKQILEQRLESSGKAVEELRQLVATMQKQLEETAAARQQLEEQLETSRSKVVQLFQLVTELETDVSNAKMLHAEQLQQVSSGRVVVCRTDVVAIAKKMQHGAR